MINWLEKLLDSMARSLDKAIAMVQTVYFWGTVAVILTVGGFLATGVIMLTDFDIMRMKYCFEASDEHAAMMFVFFVFFVFFGFMAIGEVFNFLDNHRRGLRYHYGTLITMVVCNAVLGVVGLSMARHYC